MTTEDEAATDRPRPRRTWRRWAIDIAIIIGIIALLNGWQTRSLISGEAPPLAGRLLTDEPFDLADWRGETVVVHFWATWCSICKISAGAIDSIADDHRVITVAMQSAGPRTVEAYMADKGVDFPVLMDPYGTLASEWGVKGVPTTFIVDAKGSIRYSGLGITTEPGLRGRLWAID